MKSFISSIQNIGFLTIALTLALAANFAYGQWSNPTGTAPANNIPAPLNTGTDAQVKEGALAVDQLTVFGRGFIESSAPTIEFVDTDNNDFWWHANGNSMYLIADRNDDGSWTGESPWPLQVRTGATSAGDYALFSNQIRANEYCDRNGNNCNSASVSKAQSISSDITVYQCPVVSSSGYSAGNCPSSCDGKQTFSSTCTTGKTGSGSDDYQCVVAGTYSCDAIGKLALYE